MYLDEKNEWTPAEPSRGGRRLTAREEKLFLWLIGALALMLLIAPLGGASVLQAIAALF
ncbi:hypothetical protein [Jiella sp. M17.18]|uniref:hypothetical protein n=1 Tax=Jiella sp. M17.18 TaxID=3234247 RepID=UPI0034DFE313